MYGLQRWVWATVIAVAASSTAGAQPAGINSGAQTGGVPLGSGSNLLNSSTIGGNRGTGGNTGMSGGFGTSGGGANGSGTIDTINPSGIAAPTGTSRGSLDASNRFAGYYANPYFQGNTNTQNAAPGGFGTPLYGTSTGTGGRSGGGRTPTTTGAGGFGGGGIGGRNSQSATNQSGILIPIPAQIHYTAQLRFNTPPLASSKVQADVRVALDRTSLISNSKAVQIITDLDNNVTLRGTVADEDEVRLIEGMVRLTPGVGAIKNELTPLIRGAGK